MREFNVIHEGKENGDGVIMRYRTEKGTDIFCLGVPLFYDSGGDWGLGPTWCYVVTGKKLTLIDTGQFERFNVLKSMLNSVGFDVKDIGRVIVTHGHEDHDGNLPEVIEESGADLWAHYVFDDMIAYHPGVDDGASHPEFPGSCRTCRMPDKFNDHCINYHHKRSRLSTTYQIGNGSSLPGEDFHFLLTPGHSPDCICIVFQNEVFFSGDTLLASITPHPSLMLEYLANWRILPAGYGVNNEAYGLVAYINSLDKIQKQCQDDILLMPGHRLFEKGKINYLNPKERAAEIIRFHEARCTDILKILNTRVMGLEEISMELFPPRLRAGYGKFLSQHEVMSHLELLANCGDVEWVDGRNFTSRAIGSSNYTSFFSKYI